MMKTKLRASIDLPWIAIVVALMVCAVLFHSTRSHDRLALALYDALLGVVKIAPRSDVVIIDTDRFSDMPQTTLERHQSVARLISAICAQQPHVVLVSMHVFESESTTLLARDVKVAALKSCARVVVPSFIDNETIVPLPPPALPAPAYRSLVAGIGHEFAAVDFDGTTRRILPWIDFGSGPVDAFELAAARVAAVPGWAPPKLPTSNSLKVSAIQAMEKPAASRSFAITSPLTPTANLDQPMASVASLNLRGKHVVMARSIRSSPVTLPHPDATRVPVGMLTAQAYSAVLDQRLIGSEWERPWAWLTIVLAGVILACYSGVSGLASYGWVIASVVAAVVIQWLGLRWLMLNLNAVDFLVLLCAGQLAWGLLVAYRTRSALHETIRDLSFSSVLAARTALRPPLPMTGGMLASRRDIIQSLQDTGRAVNDMTDLIGVGVNNLPSAVAWLDETGSISLANERFAVLVGATTAKETVGKNCATLLRNYSADHSFLLGNPSPPCQQSYSEFTTQTQRVFLVSHTEVSQRFGDHRTGSLVSASEITALRAAQNDYQSAITFLSHDLRSPVAALVSTAQQLKLDMVHSSAETIDRTDRIERLSRSVLAMTDEFLALARSQNANRSNFKELDLFEVVDEARIDLQATAMERGVLIVFRQNEPCAVFGDRMLLQRAMHNLIANAIRFAPRGGVVTLSVGFESISGALVGASVANRRAVVEVVDDGNGFSPAILARFASTAAKHIALNPLPSSDGHGFGLLLVQSVARMHGAAFEVKNRLGSIGQIIGARASFSFATSAERLTRASP
jgi:signal transduction histidine kinase/CHASE2 domain-containing sensor protein